MAACSEHETSPKPSKNISSNFYYVCPLYDTTQAAELLSGISIVCQTSDLNNQNENLNTSSRVTRLEDIKTGHRLQGFVSNNTRVGSFVDIGVGYDGFIHKANFKGHSLYEGTNVEVEVADIDFDTKKIGLELITVHLNEPMPVNSSNLNVSTKMLCSVCRFEFSSRKEQVQHYKLDWHRYNLKQKLQGAESVTEDAFDELADGISSLSGTEAETQDEHSGNDSETASPRRKLKMLCLSSKQRERSASVTSTDTDGEDDKPHISHSRISHKLYLRNASGDILALYRCVIHGKHNIPDNSGTLLALIQSLPVQDKWAIILIGGGHFAAAIMKGAECVAHKTFHRYTVRAKQGGSQRSHDGKHGAKSAGATLRRYNEAALQKETQELLALWSEELQSCHRIFYRASSFNRTYLFGGKLPLFKKTDQRLRKIPFPTRRATFNELLRIHKLLSGLECFGNYKLYETCLPRSPRVYLGNKSPKKSPQKSNQVKDKNLTIAVTAQENLPNQDNGEDNDVSDVEIEFEIAEEIHDTNHLKEHGCTKKPRKKKKICGPRHQQDPLSSPLTGEDYKFRTELYMVCKMGQVEKLLDLLQLAQTLACDNSLPEEIQTITRDNLLPEDIQTITRDKSLPEEILIKPTSDVSNEVPDEMPDDVDEDTLTEDIPLNKTSKLSKHSLSILSEPIGDGGATLLHIAAKEGHEEIVRILLEHGADLTIRNKQGYTPYTLASCRETRYQFRRFWANNPLKFDYSKSQIPGPLTVEQQKQQNEKQLERNRERRKIRKDRLKEKKIEDREKRVEIEDQKRFLALSDREKRALAAERRILAASRNEPIILSRCFQCGLNISGKIPFEYNNNRFCCIGCVKEHRKKEGH